MDAQCAPPGQRSMIISHRYRFIFIKTAKTAGTSILMRGQTGDSVLGVTREHTLNGVACRLGNVHEQKVVCQGNQGYRPGGGAELVDAGSAPPSAAMNRRKTSPS